MVLKPKCVVVLVDLGEVVFGCDDEDGSLLVLALVCA
jgi:hypothetical protein